MDLQQTENMLCHAAGALLEDELSPEAQVLMTALGGTMIALGIKERAPLACVLGTAGLGLMIRGMSNVPMTHLLGLGSRKPAMDMEKMSRGSEQMLSERGNGSHRMRAAQSSVAGRP